jgi:repressor LexA
MRDQPETQTGDSISEQIFAYICQYNDEHGYPPSVREIASACYIGRSSVHQYLYRLEAKGWIMREPGRARGITILRLP